MVIIIFIFKQQVGKLDTFIDGAICLFLGTSCCNLGTYVYSKVYLSRASLCSLPCIGSSSSNVLRSKYHNITELTDSSYRISKRDSSTQVSCKTRNVWRHIYEAHLVEVGTQPSTRQVSPCILICHANPEITSWGPLLYLFVMQYFY